MYKFCDTKGEKYQDAFERHYAQHSNISGKDWECQFADANGGIMPNKHTQPDVILPDVARVSCKTAILQALCTKRFRYKLAQIVLPETVNLLRITPEELGEITCNTVNEKHTKIQKCDTTALLGRTKKAKREVHFKYFETSVPILDYNDYKWTIVTDDVKASALHGRINNMIVLSLALSDSRIHYYVNIPDDAIKWTLNEDNVRTYGKSVNLGFAIKDHTNHTIQDLLRRHPPELVARYEQYYLDKFKQQN